MTCSKSRVLEKKVKVGDLLLLILGCFSPDGVGTRWVKSLSQRLYMNDG